MIEISLHYEKKWQSTNPVIGKIGETFCAIEQPSQIPAIRFLERVLTLDIYLVLASIFNRG